MTPSLIRFLALLGAVVVLVFICNRDAPVEVKPVVAEAKEPVVPDLSPQAVEGGNWWPDCHVDNITADTSCKALRFTSSRRDQYHIERGDACEAAGNSRMQCGCWIYADCDWWDNTQALNVETLAEQKRRREENKKWDERSKRK